MGHETELCNHLGRTPEERLLLRRVLDQSVGAVRKCEPCRTPFLTPRECALAKQLIAALGHPSHRFEGGYPEAERQVCVFLPDWLEPEDELPEGARVRFWDVPGTSWAYAAVTRLAGLGLLPFGSDGWFRPDAGLTWRDFSGVLDKLAQTEAGRAAFPVLAAAWSEKTLAAAEADEAAAEAVLTRAELARALNSLLGRCPDGQDAQLQAAAWYRDNQDQTAWYYADLIEASADHTCRLLPQGEQWTAIG